MADVQELSLQSLYDLLQEKASLTHTHSFVGSIESALSLQGVSYDKFVRNDLKDQTIKSYYDKVSFGIESNNTNISLKAEDNRARLEIDNTNLDVNNLTISGPQSEDVIVKVAGELLINESRVLTLNDRNEITGVDFSELEIAGRGIIVDSGEPLNTTDGVIWGQVTDEDLVKDDTPVANNNLYTVPIGTILRILSTTVPNGFLRLDGHAVSREGYTGLWKFAKAKSYLIPEAEWRNLYAQHNEVQRFSYGDGQTTFRLPNLKTDDDTIYIMKAYDDLTVREAINLQAMQDEINDINKSKVVSGVGFIKFAEGVLIQYGLSTTSACLFSIPFIDNLYTIITNYEGTAKGVDVTINSATKSATKCDFIVTNSSNVVISSSVVNYLAIGRWK